MQPDAACWFYVGMFPCGDFSTESMDGGAEQFQEKATRGRGNEQIRHSELQGSIVRRILSCHSIIFVVLLLLLLLLC